MLALGPAVGRNDVSRIEAICAEALESDPRDFMGLMVLADTLWRNKQPDRALSLGLKALELDPNDVHALRIVAGIYAERGAHEAAYPFAKRLANANPLTLSPARSTSRILVTACLFFGMLIFSEIGRRIGIARLARTLKA